MHDIQLHSLKERERCILANIKQYQKKNNPAIKKYKDIIVVSGIRVMGIIRIDYLANLC